MIKRLLRDCLYFYIIKKLPLATSATPTQLSKVALTKCRSIRG